MEIKKKKSVATKALLSPEYVNSGGGSYNTEKRKSYRRPTSIFNCVPIFMKTKNEIGTSFKDRSIQEISERKFRNVRYRYIIVCVWGRGRAVISDKI